MHWRIVKVIVALSIVGLVAYGLWPKPLTVDSFIAIKAPLTVTVEEEGKTQVIDRFKVSAPVGGLVRRINLDVGDSIEQNQIICEVVPQQSSILDPRSRAEAQARVQGALASIKAAKEDVGATKADMEFAKSEYNRKEKLLKANTVSKQDVDQVRAVLRNISAKYRSAKFAVEVAQYELTAAETALKYSAGMVTGDEEVIAIRSPVAGKVLKIHQESERVVQVGELLVEIGDPKALEIEVDVLSQDAVRIQLGAKVVFKYWGGDNPLVGTVKTVEPTGMTVVSALGVDEQRVLVISDITSQQKEWEKLGDGYRVEASFIIWHKDNVLQVPASSLFKHNNQWSLFIINKGKAQIQQVTTGQSNGLFTQILKGLEGGEAVIAYPEDSLSAGVAVKPRD